MCAFEEEYQWYIDIEFSHYMSRNKDKSFYLKNKSGNIILRNGTYAKVLGKGNANVDIKNKKVSNLLLVNGMKDNILSGGKRANKGHGIVFTSFGCKIIEEYTWKNIEKGYRNSDKLYVLKKNPGGTKR